MRQLAFARLRRSPGRYLACGLAIVLAVGFAVVVQLVGAGVERVARSGDTASLGDADVAVRAVWEGPVAQDAPAVVAALPEVAAVHRSGTTLLSAELPRTAGAPVVVVAATPPAGALRWPELTEGRWPTGPGEVAVTAEARVGEQVVLTQDTESLVAGTEGPRLPLQVVGLVDVGLASDFPVTGLFLDPAQAVSVGAGQQELLVAATPGTDPARLLAAVTDAVGPGSAAPLGDAVPADEVRDERAENSATLVLLVQGAIGAFAALAVAVAVVVVSNTYSVLLAQRVRESALLRCIGATRRDLWRGGTTEAAVLGLVAGTVGLLAGWGVAVLGGVAAQRWLPADLEVPAPSVGTVLTALALGVGSAVVASVAALVRAGAVSPLTALRPVEAVPETARSSRTRTVLGVLAVILGATGTVVGAVAGQVPLALPAALLAFGGVLALGRVLLPGVAGLLGRAVRAVGGPAGALAAASVGRNPRRTAATAGAVLIGVTLAVTAAVGAASLRATAASELGAFVAVDATIVPAGLDEAGRTALARDLAGVAGVDATALGSRVAVAVSPGAAGSDEAAAYSRSTTAWAGRLDEVAPAADVLPEAGAVVLSGPVAEAMDVTTGDTATVTADVAVTGTDEVPAVELVVLVDADTHLEVQLSPATAASLGASSTVLLAVAEELGRDGVARAVDEVSALALAADPAATVDAPVLMLGAVQQTFDVLLAVVAGMLAVTVAIALVGVSNTLSLSLVERGQENALLRALGLSRSRLRAMVAWEALVLGLVGAAVGVVLGIGFGVAGTYSLVADAGATVVAVPWLQLVGLVVLVGGVAVGASLWPAQRASRVAPASALGVAG